MMKSQNLVGEKGLLYLSISIVNWNTRDILRNCLKSIYESTHRISYEIFVVDNGSADGSAEMVEKQFPEVKLIRNKENLGFAKANNQAIRLSNGRYILLLNSDTIVFHGALDKMVEFMEDHPDAGAVGCRLLNPNGSFLKSTSIVFNLATILWRSNILHKIYRRIKNDTDIDLQSDSAQIVGWACGACLMLRKKTIDLVGMFDENFFMYSEDVDLCWRMNKGGWNIYFYPEVAVIHLKGVSINMVPGDQATISICLSYQYFLKKHYGSVGLILFRLFSTFDSLLMLLIESVVFLFLPDKKNKTRVRLRNEFLSLKANFHIISKWVPSRAFSKEVV